MPERLLEEFRYACDNVLYVICSQFVLVNRNGSYLHGYLHIGQGSETQTQVVTWGTFETNYDAVSQLKSGSTQSRHGQDLLTTVRSNFFIFFLYFFLVFYFITFTPCIHVCRTVMTTTSIQISPWFISVYLCTAVCLLLISFNTNFTLTSLCYFAKHNPCIIFGSNKVQDH